VVLWAAAEPDRMPKAARDALDEADATLMFSVVAIWEVAIKTARGRPDFAVDAERLRTRLLDAGYQELEVTGAHAIAAGRLPPLHKDPFDRMLVAQATVEGATLLTVDSAVARYGAPVRLV
jgi:PIN domain nuclease of toxin-antitoxin system